MDINSNGVGICISYDKTLTIYGQASGSGSINITSDEDAIVVGSEGGSYSGVFPCCFTVNGGNVIANSRITVYSSYYGDGRLTLGGGTLSASGYSVPGNIIYITDGWIYTDGTDFFDTGSISTPPGAATYRPKWWDGNGTSDDPYLIKTTADLDQLATRVNSYFSDYSGTYFKLDNDITYTHKADNEEGADTENNYTAIGGYFGGDIRYFSGHFDGGGHTISGIRIYQDDKDYQGLFGYIENGEVKNVILADTRITGRVEVGGIVGENYGTVSNCLYLDGSVDGSASVGGIVGKNYGTVSNCYYTSTNITSAIGYGTDGTNVGLAYMLTLGEGITCSGNALSLGGYNVATSGQEVTLTYTLSGYSCSNFSVKDDNDNDITDATLSGSVLTMPSKAVTVSSVLSSTHEAVAVGYIDKDGIEQTAQAIALDGAETSLEAGTYFVGTNITYDHTLTLDGDITLILCDGKTMTIGTSNNRVDGWGIKGFEGDDPDDANKYHNLEIYGQSAGTGALSVYSTGAYSAAITADDFTVHGGNVTATGSSYGIWADNEVNIYGGNVYARNTYNDTGNAGIHSNNVIKLGWTDYTDRIHANKYQANHINILKPLATVETNPVLVQNGDGGYLEDPNTLNNGVTLRPAAPYIDADSQTQYAADYTLLTGGGATTLSTAGWYVATGTLNYTSTVTLGGSDDYHLILTDGCHMNIGTSEKPIKNSGINGGSSLTIYGQSAGSGALSVYTKGNFAAGIVTGLITINGGYVKANATDYTGISSLNGNITLGGGIVTASSYNGIVTIADGWTYTDLIMVEKS
jgi:hypothetical protein